MRILSSIFVLLLFFASCVSSEEKVYKLAVTDIAGLEELQREFKSFQDKLSEVSGLKIKLYPVSSRTAVVEALKFRKLDFVLSGPAEYIIIAKRAKAIPLVALKRPDYYAAVITKKDSKISDIKDLKGQAIGFGPVGSTSYYLAPLELLNNGGVTLKEIKPRHVSKQIAYHALKRGDVKAVGFNLERFKQYVNADNKVTINDFKIIAKSPHLPNDLIVAGRHVSKEDQSKLIKGLTENSEELIQAILKGKSNNKYNGMKFISNINDSDYDYTRKMYAIAGFKEYS